MDVVAERAFDYIDGEAVRPIAVRVYRPEQRIAEGATHWACTVAWDGIDEPPFTALGVDSAQALFEALEWVGARVKRRDGIRFELDPTERHDRMNPWPIERGPARLPMPNE